ncbi:MAG: CHAD domain-containing protein [Spirochaetales bacterium]|nr:CHAD domain-containing protein [Spirochaetales bacterium]
MEYAIDNHGCRLFGAECLLTRLIELKKEKDGVLENKDPECLHRMRVASRRLRRALSVFGQSFSGQEKNGWMKTLRMLTRSLGRARDIDVQIDFLDKFLGKAGEDKKEYERGIRRLKLRLSQRRKQEQKEIEKVFAKVDRKNVLGAMEYTLGQITAELKILNSEYDRTMLYVMARERILLMLKNLLTYEAFVMNESAVKEHHEMRIACKFLRYELEIFQPLYGEELVLPLKTAKKIQSLLGDLHDCDVWIGFLPEFLESEHDFTREYLGSLRGFGSVKKGINRFQQDRVKKRVLLYEDFVKFWNRIVKEGVWEHLVEVLKKKINGSPPISG